LLLQFAQNEKVLSTVLSQIVGQIMVISWIFFLFITLCSSMDMLVVYCEKQYNCVFLT